MSLREAAEVALEALQIGESAAESIAEEYHKAMKGYRQARHDALDADVQKIRSAIEALRDALADPYEEIAANYRKDVEALAKAEPVFSVTPGGGVMLNREALVSSPKVQEQVAAMKNLVKGKK